MKDLWNSRYNSTVYVYGEEPNTYLKAFFDTANHVGQVLFPGEGEGRNAVYAAKLGWKVVAFDYSNQGKVKAEMLAKKNGVTIDYLVCDAAEFRSDVAYDVIAFSFFHIEELVRKPIFENLFSLLKPGGKVIMEVFSTGNLKYGGIMGPKNIDLLYSEQSLRNLMQGFHLEHIAVETVTLNEGDFHKGQGEVINLLAIKR